MCVCTTVWCRSSKWVELRIRGVYKRHGDVRFCFSIFLFSLLFSPDWPFISSSLFQISSWREKERDMTNIAHTLRSLRPEASALLMDNLGLASVGESPPQVLRRQSQQTCDAGILGHSGQCVPESSCSFVNSPSPFYPRD